MRVSAAIKSLIHGVTTDNLVNADSRYMAEQVNTITRIDEGLTKRPPTEKIADMGNALATDGTEFVKDFVIHDVAYFVTVRNTAPILTVTREDGHEFVVSDNANDTYLNGITEDTLRLTVHGELVFILNNTKTVEMAPNDTTYITNSMLFIKQPVPEGSSITVTCVDHTDTYRTATVTVPASLQGTAPDNIAAQLATSLDAHTNLSASHAGAVVQVVRTDGVYADLTVDCDFGVEDYFVPMNGRVESFLDLPKYSYHGAVMKVQPYDQSLGDPVYMKAQAEGIKDAENALEPPAASWPTPDLANLPLKWYEQTPGNLDPSPLAGEPTNPSVAHFLGYRASHQGAITIDGVNVYRITVASVFGNDLSYTNNRLIIEWFDAGDATCPMTAVSPPDTASHTFRWSTAIDPLTTIRSTISSSYTSTVCTSQTIHYWSDLGTTTGEIFYSGTNYNLYMDAAATVPSVSTGLILCNWDETAAPGIEIDISSATMPHVLQPVDADNFAYIAPNWIDRDAGDDTTNPLPRFIGNAIEDIIIFQNRLAVLTNDEFVASETNNVFNFHRDTITQLLSKHPVNLRSTSADSSKLHHFVYHNRDLLITAGRQQYKIDGSIALSALTASMQLTTAYNASETVKPVSIGNSVYIPNHHGDWLNMSKYNGATKDLAPDAADNITQHARKYISGTVNSLAGLANHGLIFANYSLGQSIYVCNYDTMLSRAEDQRFAWFRWEDFSDDSTYNIRAIATTKNTLMIVIGSASGLELMKMNMDSGIDQVYMDSQVINTTTGTTVTLGTEYNASLAEIKVVQGVGCPSPGDYVGTVSLIAGVLTLDTDMLGGTVYVGREFNVQVVPNLVTVRDEGGTVNNAANLRINGFDVRVRDTGKMTATERSPYDTYEVQEFTGLVSGSLDAITDQEATTTDIFKVGFKQHADKGTVLLESKSWLPMTITQIDWKGNYKSRGRRF